MAIARTPSEVAHRDNKLTLLHYTPEKKDPLWTRSVSRSDIDLVVGALFNMPGPMTGAAFAMMNPVGTRQKYTQGVLRSLGDNEALRGFLRVEKRLYDQPDYPGEGRTAGAGGSVPGQQAGARRARAWQSARGSSQRSRAGPSTSTPPTTCGCPGGRALAGVVGTRYYMENEVPGGSGIFRRRQGPDDPRTHDRPMTQAAR